MLGTTLLAYTGGLNIYSLVTMVIIFNAAQWLLAPYLVNAIYKVRRLDPQENPGLHMIFDDLSARSGVKTPKLMISDMLIPNAFAYGSPLTGNHVAITKGILTSLEGEEVEAVLAHELGHIKHRDVQVTMLISVLPSLFYIIAQSTMFARYGSRDRRNGGGLALVGSLSMLLYFGMGQRRGARRQHRLPEDNRLQPIRRALLHPPQHSEKNPGPQGLTEPRRATIASRSA